MVDWRTMTAGVQKLARGVFGTPAVYRVGGNGAGVAIRGIFRDAATDVVVELRVDAAMVAPVFDVLEADLPVGAHANEDDTVELTDHGGATYRVRDFEPDGEGILRLVLTEA